MSNWLSEIENYATLALEGDEVGEYMDELRMARVLREFIRYIRVLRSTDDSRERLTAYNSICSPDAKELLK